MTTRSRGPSAGFGWLTRGIGVGFRHPRPLFGGAALLMLLVLLPALVTVPMQLYSLRAGTPLNPAVFGGIMVGSMLLGLLIMPVYAGYLQVVDAAERGLPARARDIFTPYRQGEAPRLIGYGLTMIVLYAVMVATIVAATGGGIAHWYMQVVTAQLAHQPPPTALPQGFAAAVALFAVLSLFLMGFKAISLGQVALGRRGVFGAIGDGLAGALKNVLPLLVFALSAMVAWIAVVVGFVIVGLLLALLGKLVGAWLVIVFIVPLYIVLLLTVLAAMFGVMYHLWRDVCGDGIAASMAPSIAA
jgi:hypothetical protein